MKRFTWLKLSACAKTGAIPSAYPAEGAEQEQAIGAQNAVHSANVCSRSLHHCSARFDQIMPALSF